MNAKRCILTLAVLATAAWATPAGAVVNGEKVDPATVPWYVDLGSCGSTLVSPDRLLTAAHCVRGMQASDYPVIVVAGQQRRAAHLALHPNWRQANGATNFLDDVAIVALDAPVTGVPTVTLGGAAPEQATILGRGRAYAPGTGHSEAQMLDGSLRGAPLRLLDDRACATALKGYRPATGERFDPRMRCAIDADGREPRSSGCFGDSGGPLWTGAADAPVQLGVVSWGGDRCGADGLPSVFADVERYRAFILDPAPTWSPTVAASSRRAAKIAGTAATGRTLRCSVTGYRPATGTTTTYAWNDFGRGRGASAPPKRVGTGRSLTVAKKLASHRIGCAVAATNDGGYATVAVKDAFIKR